MRAVRKTALLAAAALALPSPALARTFVRADQLGYVPGAPKALTVISSRPLGGARFRVRGPQALSGRIPRAHARWSGRFPFVYRIDVSRVRAPGRYRIAVPGASGGFLVATPSALYSAPAASTVAFLTRQRDVFHQNDAAAGVFGAPPYRGLTLAGPLEPTGTTVDVAGGWFDAGDYLKFTETASFTDVALLFAAREYAAPAQTLAEARWGTDWLLEMWDARRRVLYMQVGLGDGNARVDGDHDVWRVPQRDDAFGAVRRRYLAHRPVFAANAAGSPVPPSLAGRTAAAFALCAQLFGPTDPAYAARCRGAGESLYAAAATRWKGPLPASVPRAYYDQPGWFADMELGAVELYRATGQERYLEEASEWADRYMTASGAGSDSLNLFDPAALAHYDLYRAMVASGHTTDLSTDARQVLGDLRDQLALGTRLARRDAFGLANPAGRVDTVPHALGYAVEARLYDALAESRSYEAFAQRELDWVLGANAWGSAFVTGVGTRSPRCLQDQVANLTGRVPSGAVVDGPTDAAALRGLGAPDGFRRCPAGGGDRYRAFDTARLRYLDDVRSATTSEPADDYVALGLLAFAQATTSPDRSR